MTKLKTNIRFYVLSFSLALSIIVFLWIDAAVAQGSLQIIRLTQTYALIALAYLYITLLISPFCLEFKPFPFRSQLIRARRATGVSVFYFGTLHACIAFFGQLKGFNGLAFLSSRYLWAISLSFAAWIIFLFMAATAFDRIIKAMAYSRWKVLHRLIYLAGVLVLIHALMLGTHFATLVDVIPQIAFIAIALLLFLEGKRIDAFLASKVSALPRFGPVTLLVAGILIASLVLYLGPVQGGSYSVSIHAKHLGMANVIQGKLGPRQDGSGRFTVSLDYPELILPNNLTKLRFEIFDANTGNRIQDFDIINEKRMHLIIVDSDLRYYSHLHPEQNEQGFYISTIFPKSSQYHLYVDFQPSSASEQQFAFALQVGYRDELPVSEPISDLATARLVEGYRVTLSNVSPLKAEQLSAGEEKLRFWIEDHKGNPVRTLRPYLSSFGHLVMINQDTFEYLHVHPTAAATGADDRGGPDIEFTPMGLYGPIKPGVYRIFLQLKPDVELILADFTIKVE